MFNFPKCRHCNATLPIATGICPHCTQLSPAPAQQSPSESVAAPAEVGQVAGTSLEPVGDVVAVNHAAFLVHFLNQSQLAQTVGEGWKLIKAVHDHLSIDDAAFVSDTSSVGDVGGTESAFKRGFDRGHETAVITGCCGIWNELGGIDHNELTPAHRRVLAYTAKYLRKLSETQKPA